MFLPLIGILLASWYLYYRIKMRREYRLASQFPGPTIFPFLGSVWRFMNIPPEEMLSTGLQLYSEFGGIYRVWVGMHKVAFIVSEARYAEIVLGHSHKYLAKSDIYAFLSGWLGDGLLLSTGQKWRNRRKVITPAFHFKILEQFEEIFERNAEVLVGRLAERADDAEAVNVYEYVSLAALDNVCEAAMGTKINAQLDAHSSYVKAVHDMSQTVAMRISKIWTRIPLLFWIFAHSLKRRQDRSIQVLHEFTQRVIRTRREQLLATKSTAPTDTSTTGDGIREKHALLDILLHSTIDGQPLSDADIREEVDTFMFEGHDTTTSAICFALHLLSRTTRVQDKLLAEIRQELTAEPNFRRMVHNLKYMELVIKESMRLYPPVSFIGRRVEEDTRIDANRTIPANSNFAINLSVMFRDPKVFERPNDFWPERFEASSSNSSNKATSEVAGPYAFCPFSAGTRNCIGQKFAMLEMKSTLAKLVLGFELLEAGPELIVVNELILRSTNGIHMRLRQRGE